MVVAQASVFKDGYFAMDPALIPQFEEGEREKDVRQLLEEDGLGHLEFSTGLD
ncbi:hypothetical protein IW262DRAFT_1456400 [Armillaria fumosa]|nr:hypothetical protein IW262DRAFT_1456400 [Armillaria fumosa]